MARTEVGHHMTDLSPRPKTHFPYTLDIGACFSSPGDNKSGPVVVPPPSTLQGEPRMWPLTRWVGDLLKALGHALSKLVKTFSH